MKGNWKERGVVPDTDDEEEDNDFQSVWSDEGREGENVVAKELHERKDTARSPVTVDKRHQQLSTQLEQAEQSLELKARLSAERSSQRVRGEVPDSASSEKTVSLIDSIGEGPATEPELPPPTANRTPPKERAPTPVEEWLEQQHSSQLPDLPQLVVYQHASSIRPAEHLEDEISKTYVRISSPSPSLSSVGSSHFAEQEPQCAANRAQSPSLVNAAEADPILHIAQDTSAEIDSALIGDLIEDEPQYHPSARRSLRPRTTIQLHPFLIEAERHKNQFKGANLAPLRIVATQENTERAQKAANPQNEDSQDTDFVIEGDSQESQSFNHAEAARALEELLSSPARAPRLVSRASSRPFVVEIPSYRPSPVGTGSSEGGNDDADLPVIQDLFARPEDDEQRVAMCRRNFKRIQARQKKAEARDTAAAQPRPASRVGGDIFDVPDSPPATSSPTNGAANLSTLTPSASARPNQQKVPASTLPTPAASSSARRAVTLAIDVPDDDVDTPPSSIEQSSGSSPLREPPPKLRKMLRGVLPASYLHISRKIDNPRPAPAPFRMRDSRSVSPGRGRDLNRRGIAVPRVSSGVASSMPQSEQAALYCLAEDEGSDDERPQDDSSPMRGLVQETNDESQGLPSVYSQSEFDFASEDNSSLVDPMLPSRHKRNRQAQPHFDQPPSKRQKSSSSNLFRNMHGGPRYQPRIVDVFEEEQPARREWQWDEDNDALPDNSARSAALPRRPYRAIEEVMPQFTEPVKSLPPFMRIAARSAGSRVAIGRQGPGRKYVRLDQHKATVEAQSVLRHWRGRSPVQRKPPSVPRASAAPRASLRDISTTAANVPARPNKPTSAASSRSLQTSLKAFRKPAAPRQRMITWGAGGSRDRRNRIKVEGRNPKTIRRAPGRRPEIIVQARTAQLEVSQAEYSVRNNQSAFGANKRNLDKGFHRQHREKNEQNNLALQRFLEDSDEEKVGGVPSTAAHIAATIKRRRKRAPKQIDAEAAKYRQPENIIASIEVPTPIASVAYFDDELRGLGGPNTVYPIDFDIKPLRSDIYFHESTFIGKGKLSKALDFGEDSCITRSQHRSVSYTLSGNDLKWGVWDETISSQVRSCFEWIIQRLDIFANIDDEEVDTEIISCMVFMVDYFQEALAFDNGADVRLCIERMTKVMGGLTDCLEVLTASDRLQPGDNINSRRIEGLSTFQVVLIFQVLRLATTHQSSSQDSNVPHLEALLQRAATTSVNLLFIVGLSPLDDLYEDLRKEAFRQGGIRENHGPAQAWVILMHIFTAAKIRRVSFWDAINAHLLTNIQLESNVKVMEKSWQTIFLLLPLMEFDKFGILKSGSRYRSTSENWALPQKLIRRVFEFYSPCLKNVASFTNYCNTLFNRCLHLIQAWGWRRYGSILGTLFDFFAKHQFAHIGPQRTSMQQSEFLHNLDNALSSFVVSEDQCFTVFLKIVHSSTRQLREVGDQKEIRNLVTRLLPNHSLDNDSQDAEELSKESLRNHHDLLLTLYWAAPTELKEKIKVMLDSVERRKREIGARKGRDVVGRR